VCDREFLIPVAFIALQKHLLIRMGFGVAGRTVPDRGIEIRKLFVLDGLMAVYAPCRLFRHMGVMHQPSVFQLFHEFRGGIVVTI
jgi:hypothetical protein